MSQHSELSEKLTFLLPHWPKDAIRVHVGADRLIFESKTNLWDAHRFVWRDELAKYHRHSATRGCVEAAKKRQEARQRPEMEQPDPTPRPEHGTALQGAPVPSDADLATRRADMLARVALAAMVRHEISEAEAGWLLDLALDIHAKKGRG